MGLFRALMVIGISSFIIEYIKHYDTTISNIPVINKLHENKYNYSYLVLVIVFLIELIL